jgi:hypothetical protein
MENTDPVGIDQYGGYGSSSIVDEEVNIYLPKF